MIFLKYPEQKLLPDRYLAFSTVCVKNLSEYIYILLDNIFEYLLVSVDNLPLSDIGNRS